MAGHVVGDEGGGDVVLLQFPDGEARALQERAGFVGEDVDALAGFDGRADDAEGGAVAGGGERAGVAVGEDGAAIGHERRAVAADSAIDGDIFLTDEPGFFDEAAADGFERLGADAGIDALHALDGPEEIDGGGTRGGEGLADHLEAAVEIGCAGLEDAERNAHGRGHADGGRAANRHIADGFGNLRVGTAGDVRLFERQAALIDHDNACIGPFDGFDHEGTILTGITGQGSVGRSWICGCL